MDLRENLQQMMVFGPKYRSFLLVFHGFPSQIFQFLEIFAPTEAFSCGVPSPFAGLSAEDGRIARCLLRN